MEINILKKDWSICRFLIFHFVYFLLLKIAFLLICWRFFLLTAETVVITKMWTNQKERKKKSLEKVRTETYVGDADAAVDGESCGQILIEPVEPWPIHFIH